MPAKLKMVVREPAAAMTFPWNMEGRLAATRRQRERGGRLCIGVIFESPSKKLGHRLDFDFHTGEEVVT